jgi:hypothetical protein
MGNDMTVLKKITCTYSVVSIKQTGCNKRTGWPEFFIYYMKKEHSAVQKIFLLHKK